MNGPDPAFSVVIATRDRPQQLEKCLQALQASIGEADEVLVVDSCSLGTGTGDVASRLGVRVLRCDRPGASLARNTGWRAAAHDVVAFVDDDVRVSPAWAQSVRQVMAEHPEAAFCTGALALLPEDVGTERPVAFFDNAEPFVIDRSVLEELGHGANLVVRRQPLEVVGGYDERLGPGTPWPAAEDLELIDRLLADGRTGRYEPAVQAFHVQWRGRRELLRLEWRYGIGQGARLGRLAQLDPERYRAVHDVVWRAHGSSELSRLLRARYKFATLSTLVRLAGTATGRATAALARVRGGDGRPAARIRPGDRDRPVRPSRSDEPAPRNGPE